ncbi:alpha/beta fold hydrolase [Hydrogenophaga aquatica]
MIEQRLVPLPHGIELDCRMAGDTGRPVLLFLHGFPEAAFVWDGLLEHFSHPDHGGYRCVAPNLRGYGQSSAPAEVSAYRARHLVQDVTALIDLETAASPTPGRLACLVAHDWGGAIAWNLGAQHPHLLQRLAILNSPHPGTFLRELQHSPEQQAASAYMNFLVRPDAEALLRQDDFRRLWEFFSGTWGSERSGWMTETLRQAYHDVWNRGLNGALNYYRASPLRPPDTEAAANPLELPAELLHVGVPTLVIWGEKDRALLPGLLDGLERFVPDMRIERVSDASHWIVHEQPERVASLLDGFIRGH